MNSNSRIRLRDIDTAVQLLTKAIGCYGKLIETPISIRWGNGVILYKNGIMISGGTEHVAKAIFTLMKGKKK